MSKNRLPLTFLVVSVMIVIVLLFHGASQILAFFNTGANMDDMLLLDPKSINSYYQPKITWEELENEGREMEEHTLQKISKDYLASYYHQFYAMNTYHVKGLHDYYTDKARSHLEELVGWYETSHQFLRGTTIEHSTQLDFYSEDGTLATLTDSVISYQTVSIDDEVWTRRYDTSSYQVMLLLEDNFWRIRHRVRGEFPVETKREYPIKNHPSHSYVKGHHIYFNDSLFRMKGMNYYPKEHSWIKMWEDFDSIDFKTDFGKIREVGFNTIRVFLPYDQFGRGQVDGQELEKFKRLMDMAHDARLKVVVTLFDFFLGYAVEEWTLTDKHLEAIIGRVSGHPALLGWDLKNEPDLDFENIGEQEVLEWLKFTANRLKRYDPNALITIGWSQPEYCHLLEDQLDFLSFHFYRETEQLEDFLSNNTFNKPLFLGETGKHTFSKWWYPFSSQEQEQVGYYQQIINIIEKHELHYAFWTLYDFSKVPSGVAGRWPWQKGPQTSYGLVDKKGNKKQAYEIIKKLNNDIAYEKGN